MNGYLARLVDRAVGLPAAAVSPRLEPVFPLGAPAPEALDDVPPSLHVTASPAAPRRDRHPASFQADPAARTKRTARPHGDRPAPGGLDRAPEGPPRAPRRAERDAVAPQVPTVKQGRRIRKSPRAEPAARPAAAAHAQSARVEAYIVAQAPTSAAESRPVDRERHGPDAPLEAKPRGRAATSVAVPHLAARKLPPSGTSAAPPERTPRIEVRIGRVEIRRPQVPDPVQRPGPVVEERSPASFGELAAARRYVDRGWS